MGTDGWTDRPGFCAIVDWRRTAAAQYVCATCLTKFCGRFTISQTMVSRCINSSYLKHERPRVCRDAGGRTGAATLYYLLLCATLLANENKLGWENKRQVEAALLQLCRANSCVLDVRLRRRPHHSTPTTPTQHPRRSPSHYRERDSTNEFCISTRWEDGEASWRIIHVLNKNLSFPSQTIRDGLLLIFSWLCGLRRRHRRRRSIDWLYISIRPIRPVSCSGPSSSLSLSKKDFQTHSELGERKGEPTSFCFSFFFYRHRGTRRRLLPNTHVYIYRRVYIYIY